MGNERQFVTTLMTALEKDGAYAWKPADGFTLGIPDIHAVLSKADGRFLVAEVKEVEALLTVDLKDLPADKKLLKHRFSGPQISMLRALDKCGAVSVGVVRTHKKEAYCLPPTSIPINGQVTPALLLKAAMRITPEIGWMFWEC